jgi:hypothetical protein
MNGAVPQHASLCIGRRKYDVVTVEANGASVQLRESEAREHYASTPEGKDFPNDFLKWWERKKLTHRGWTAEFISGATKTPVDLTGVLWDTWGFPVATAMTLLDGLAAEGWRLLHVSEDHGLYSGADAANEAYLTRTRYLLTRTM